MRLAGRMALQTPLSCERRAERVSVEVAATMRALGYHGADVSVRNISERGFMAETRAEFPANCYVRLKLPGLGTVMARIVWAADGQVGGEFFTPVTPERLRQTIGLGPAAQA